MSKLTLSHLSEGDIFHAECTSGARLICIVEDVTSRSIIGRAITTQERLIFNLTTGYNSDAHSRCNCRINQTRQLPHDLRRIMFQIDRKYRLKDAPEGSRLLPEEISGMIMLDEFYGIDQDESGA